MPPSPPRRRLSLVRNIISAAAFGQECWWPCLSQLPPRTRCRSGRFHSGWLRRWPNHARTARIEMIFYEYVCSRWTTGDDGQLPVHVLDGNLRGPMLIRGQTPRRAFGKGADWLKSGPGLDFLDRWRRRLRRHWLRRYHGQHSPSPRTARRAAARAGCRLQLKINYPTTSTQVVWLSGRTKKAVGRAALSA